MLKCNSKTAQSKNAHLETEAHIRHVTHLPTQQMQIAITANHCIDRFPNLLQQHVFRRCEVLPLGEQDIPR